MRTREPLLARVDCSGCGSVFAVGDMATATSIRILAPIFFMVFTTIATFMMLSLFVGVITNSMSEAASAQRRAFLTKRRISMIQVQPPACLSICTHALASMPHSAPHRDCIRSRALCCEWIGRCTQMNSVGLRSTAAGIAAAGSVCIMRAEARALAGSCLLH